MMKDLKLNVDKEITSSRRNTENYKSLRANIDFCSSAPKVIMVTSSIPGEGKSTVSLHLANEIANSGKKTLLLDCDLRKSHLADDFQVSEKDRAGVSDVLVKRISTNDALFATNNPHLYVILNGTIPPNPTELLERKQMGLLIDLLRKVFDYIIVDAPPMASVIDAAIISKWCDGILFVVASDVVSYRIVQRATGQLERAGGNILGMVLNKIKFSNRALYGTYGANKYYYGTYSKYYDEEGEKS